MNYVILAADKHTDYQFLLPLTCILWATRTNYRPLAITAVETPTLKFLSDADLIDCYVLNEIENDRLAIKLTRWYSHNLVKRGDNLLLQDVDVWPISGDFWNRYHARQVTCHYGDAFQYKRHCTSGFRASFDALKDIAPGTWMTRLEELRKLEENDEKRHSDDAAQSELVIKWMKKNPDGYELVDRGPSPPKDRIDRSNWPTSICEALDYNKVDIHLPRDASDRRVWELIEPYFDSLAPGWESWSTHYRAAWERTNQ